MLKILFATSALLAATATVAKVRVGPEDVTVGNTSVGQATLQLHETENGLILASKNVVEPLGGLVEVTVEGGVVTLEPGVRLARMKDEKGQEAAGFELTSHGRRQISVTAGDQVVTAFSPLAIVPIEGGWKVGESTEIAAANIRASLVTDIAGERVAAKGEAAPPPPDGKGGNVLKTTKLDIRRVMYEDPLTTSAALDEPHIKRDLGPEGDVSPAGF